MRAWDFPKSHVVLSCDVCGRYGRYTKERFLEIVGRNTSLADARRIIAGDCPHKPKWSGDVRARCGVGYPDLVKSGQTAEHDNDER